MKGISGVVFVLLAVLSGCSPKFYGQFYNPPVPRPDFTLQGSQGPVSLSDYRGKLVILFFGFTSCPDVCPTALAYARQALKLTGLGPDKIQMVFVSVDWPHDTPEEADKFAKEFSPDFVGLTGSQKEIEKTVQDFAVYFRINPPDKNGVYTLDHTASTFLLDRNGQLQLTWSYYLSPQEIARDLEELVKG